MKRILALSGAIILVLCGCQSKAGKARGPDNVLVVVNSASAESVEIGNYYARKRLIGAKFICKIKCPTDEKVGDDVFAESIRDPIRKHVTDKRIKDQIDYIVLTHGIPIRTGGRWGVDSALTCLFQDTPAQMNNPYYNADEPFDHKSYGMYLVTRLDGRTLDDAKALVDRALTAKPETGLFLFDLNTGLDGKPGYKYVNDYMRNAARVLRERGMNVELYEAPGLAVRTGLMGYFGWGSNDWKYRLEDFRGLRFLAGSIAEVAYSSSAITLNGKHHWKEDESNIADLVSQGVTGVKGYVQEPFATAIADGEILFDRYTRGYNLAESFYAASRFVYWRDIVLGDPLCAPYAKRK